MSLFGVFVGISCFLPVCGCVRGSLCISLYVMFSVCILRSVECLQGLLGVVVSVPVCLRISLYLSV